MRQNGSPKVVIEFPLQQTEEHRVDRGYDNADDPLLEMRQAKYQAGDSNRQHDPQYIFSKQIAKQFLQVTAVNDLLTQGSQCPTEKYHEQQLLQVALKAGKIAVVDRYSGQAIEDGHHDANVK